MHSLFAYHARAKLLFSYLGVSDEPDQIENTREWEEEKTTKQLNYF